MQVKPRVVKDYDRLDSEIQEQIKLNYPYGFEKHLIRFTNSEGKYVSALPFETDDKYYLIRMTANEAQAIIRDDDDYDSSGKLRSKVYDILQDRYGDDDEEEDEMEEEEELDEIADVDAPAPDDF
ncbi:MAG: hypothetical protein R3330_07445 [Saprospiraceae bacterium]|nr:hypothetical protein [Saprospiraceae bacterium]